MAILLLVFGGYTLIGNIYKGENLTIHQSLLPENSSKTGEKLLEILQKESGKAMPSEGFLAGQSVTSALMQLHNQQGVVYNDLDVFFAQQNKSVLVKYGLWHEKIHEPMRSVTAHKLCSTKYEVNEFNHLMGEQTEYAGALPDERVLKLSRGIIIHRVTRNEEFNNIVYSPLSSYDGIDKTALYHLDQNMRDRLYSHILAKNVLRSFDLNSVKIGIDLQTGEVITENSFRSWVKSRQLGLDHVQTPIQSFIRFMDKLKHSGNYGNVELELAKTFCLLTYRNLAGIANHAKRAKANGSSVANFARVEELYQMVNSESWAKASKQYLPDMAQTDCPYTFFENAVSSLTEIPKFEKMSDLNIRFGDYGINVIGQKYYEKALMHPIVMDYFEFIPIEKCYLVQPKKIPKLIKEFGAEFFMYASNEGVGFLEDHQSIVNPISLVDPKVDNRTKTIIRGFGRMSQNQRSLTISALFKNNQFGSSQDLTLSSEFLTGYDDVVNSKYIELANRHKTEMAVFSQVQNLRTYYSCLKKLYNAIDKSFKIQNEYLFFSMFNKFQSAVGIIEQRQNDQRVQTLELDEDVYDPNLNIEELFTVSIEQYYAQKCRNDPSLPLYQEALRFKEYLKKDMTGICSEEFVDFCLNAYVSANERQSLKKRVELNTKIPQSVLDKATALFDDKVVVEIRELNTALELENEGFKMSHCVGGYSTYVQNGRSRIFSLALKTADGYEFSTLEVQVRSQTLYGYNYGETEENKNDKWRFIQNRGLRNAAPSGPLASAGYALVAALNEYEAELEAVKTSVVEVRHSSALGKQVGVSR